MRRVNSYIPQWLLVEVLIRLPLKLIFRFKLVSKEWLSTILDPDFIGAYCYRALLLSCYQPWTILSSVNFLKVCKRPYRLDYSSNKGTSFHPFSLSKNCISKNYCINGVSNGLVLFKKYGGDYRLRNPATGQWLALPPPHFDIKRSGGVGFHATVEDGVLVSFIVVRFEYKLEKCELYSSESGKWEMFDVQIDKPTPVVMLRSPCTILNGTMHWLASNYNVMIAYDLHNSDTSSQLLHTITLPEGNLQNDYKNICSTYQGKLRYFSMREREFKDWNISIWVMNDYSSRGWCLQHRVRFADIKLIGDDLWDWDSYLRPIAFHPYDDSDIVYLKCADKLRSYNMKTKEFKCEGAFHHIERGSTFFSLMIPPWPISLCHPSITGWEGNTLFASEEIVRIDP